MTTDSPNLNWTPYFEGGGSMSTSNSASDLFWSKGQDDTSLNSLTGGHFDIRNESSNHLHHTTSSSAASSQSDSDIFPISNIHQLPAWNTIGNLDETTRRQSNNSRQSGKNKSIEDSFTHVSPGDAYSTSGLSDKIGDDGFKDDLWFIPSPETGDAHSSHSLLQRKKRMNFLNSTTDQSSTLISNNKFSLGSPNNLSLPSTLKNFKSVPNLKRRISSGYTARLEELLSEMGWPKQDENTIGGGGGCGGGDSGMGENSIAQDSDIGNDTIQYTTSAGQSNQSTTNNVQSSGNQSYTDNSNGNTGSGSGNGFGRSLQTTNSALYQRRAESRDGLMPVPSPVTVVKKPEGNEAINPSSSFLFVDTTTNIEDQQEQSTLSQDVLTNLNAVTQSSLNQQKAAALVAKQQQQQQQQQQGVNQNVIEDFSNGTFSLPPSSSSNIITQLGASPITTGRPNTGSSGSNTTELHTPITPFVGLSLNSAPTSGSGVNNNDILPQVSWSTNPNQYSFIGAGTGNKNINDLTLLQFNNNPTVLANKKDFQVEYLANLQNSLGLYNLPNNNNSSNKNNNNNLINPNAILDSSNFTSFSPIQPATAIGLMPSASLKSDIFTSQSISSSNLITSNQHHQKLIFPPQQQKVMPVGTSAFGGGGQRPRAGTAMAALGGMTNHPSPRHMRSTPNLHMSSPSPSLDGSQYASISAATGNVTPTTPNKSIRKIASNRRLNMLNATPETPSMHLSYGVGAGILPSSPISPSKRGRGPGGGGLTSSTSFGGSGSGTTFEFINYGIEDADELCSAVAPSGSYKVPLKGFGGNEDDDDDDFGGGYSGGGGGGSTGDDAEGELDENIRRPSITSIDSEGNLIPPLSPRKGNSSKKSKSSTNRTGPRWEDPDAPPVPSIGTSITTDNDKVEGNFTNLEGSVRQIKRRKSDASMMLSGRKKSPSMSNLRKV